MTASVKKAVTAVPLLEQARRACQGGAVLGGADAGAERQTAVRSSRASMLVTGVQDCALGAEGDRFSLKSRTVWRRVARYLDRPKATVA